MEESIKDIADMLDGIEYMDKRLDRIAAIARERGIVIVTGASDDLMEFCGAIEDEGDCYDGGAVYFDKDGVSYGEDGSQKENEIEAIWCGKAEDGEPASWVYKTDIPHETFKMYEYGDLYCEGIVFSIEDLK